MANQEVTTNQILDLVNDNREILDFMKDSMATKDDMRQLESSLRHDIATKDDLKAFATKDDLHNFKDELIGHIDGFAKRISDQEQEIASAHSRCSRIEQHVGIN
ncbi:MAG: hypothetical protein V1738_04965 [Patescibacteria group bacterium]